MHRTTTWVFAAMTIGLVASACSAVTEKADATATTSAAPVNSATMEVSGPALAPLLPAPADTQLTKGPDNIADNGIHLHYQVNGSPNDVMSAYKSALEDKGWAITTIVSSGGDGGGGATYTGMHGNAYGVFDGGGYANNTYIDVCAWPAKPANPNCGRGAR
ncbi:hypothetical protein [Mycolicibacterium frederiksbergense]|nr:hypothetical protein [Mycolicibacterium frederiksbergense]